MDCDFSHDPRDVPRLIAAAEDGADLVLGSRYVPGGSIPNWGALRRVRLARREPLRAGLPAEPDPRPDRRLQVLPPRACSRRSPLDAIDSKGYAFQIETTYRVRRAGFRVVEIPIAFTDREHGHSKMNGAIVLEAIWKVPLLRLRALAGPPVTWPAVRDVTDASFERGRAPGRQAGRRRLLGAVVRAVPGGPPDPRAARRRDRQGRVREARHRREPRQRVALRRALDPDGDPVRRRRGAGDGDRRAPGRALPRDVRQVLSTARRPSSDA